MSGVAGARSCRSKRLAFFCPAYLFGRLITADQVESDLAQDGEIAGGNAITHPAFIVSERHVEHPMQVIRDRPMLADRPGQNLRCIMTTVKK